MKKLLYILITLIFLTSCSENPIFYEYDGVTITRIDKGTDIYFYYGKCTSSKADCRKSYIKATYRGFNSGIYALVVFKENKIVEIYKDGGYFEKIGENPYIFIYSRSPSDPPLPWIKEAYIKGFSNMIFICNLISAEQERNEKKITNVKAIYPESK